MNSNIFKNDDMVNKKYFYIFKLLIKLNTFKNKKNINIPFKHKILLSYLESCFTI